MIRTYMGSVQPWECDAMGHFNVQFYVAKAAEGISFLAHKTGFDAAFCRDHAVALKPEEQHIRFLKELRPGTPFVIFGGSIPEQGDRIAFYQEIRHTVTDEVHAAITTYCRPWGPQGPVAGLLPSDFGPAYDRLAIEMPAHGRPRGLAMQQPRAAPVLAEADQKNMFVTYQGCVSVSDCDAGGGMLDRHYIGRISDSMANLVALAAGLNRAGDDRQGGAALEYRLVYRSRPHAGDLLALRSGVQSIAAKTCIWVHWLFDLATGKAVATAEAVAISLDLQTRRAIDMSPETRANLTPRLDPDLSA